MWNENYKHELKDNEVAMGRTSGSSDVVVMDERVLEAAGVHPGITKINVTKSTRLHIGPKFVSVTQNVDNTEVVKGRVLGLELVSPQNTKRLRCSIAVFVCWALVVASTLTFFIFYFALAKQQARLDLDLPLPRYLWDILKSTTKVERISCGAALILLLVCIILIVYFTVIAKKTSNIIDVAPHKWYITRDMWLAPPFEDNGSTQPFNPLRLVLIAHTVGAECNRFDNCAAELRNLQGYYQRAYGYDLPYNFIVGNEGRVYEGRGWNTVGAHTYKYNRCTLGVAFIGDYREGLPSYSKVTSLQLERTRMLLDKGVELGYLHPNFHILGHKDVKDTQSPGNNLYNAIRQWPNYNHENIYRNKTCEEIHDMFLNQNQTNIVTATIRPILGEQSSVNDTQVGSQ